MRQQIELAAIVGAVALATERHDAIGLVAAAERARHQMRRVDGAAQADEAARAGHLGSLRLLFGPILVERETGQGQVAYPPALVERVRREHAASRSLRAIARLLTAEGVPTVRGGREWYASTVAAVLRRTQARACAIAFTRKG
jgi:recombinase